MEPFLVIAYSLLFLFITGKWRFFNNSGVPVKALQAGLILKFIAGIGLGLVYSRFYTDRSTADTFKFFDDSAILFQAFHQHPLHFFKMITGIDASNHELDQYYNRMVNWYDVFSPVNDNRTMIRFNALLRFISFGFYNVHVIIACFLSMLGIVAVIHVIHHWHSNFTFISYLSFILIPSVVFWGSGLLKDTLVFFAAGMCIYNLHAYCLKKQVASLRFITIIFSMTLLMLVRFQIFILFVPLMAGWVLSTWMNMRPIVSIIVTTSIYSLFILTAGSLFLQTDLTELLSQKQQSFINLAEKTDAGSTIQIPTLKPTIESLLQCLPAGLSTALLRPFITDGENALSWISAIENSLILLLILWCIAGRYKLKSNQTSVFFWFALTYSIMYLSIIGTITPVLGAIVRYKSQVVPFLIFCCIIASGRKFSFFNRISEKMN